MSNNVIKADYYFIAPIRVTDWGIFSKEFVENKDQSWNRATDANEFSLKEQVVGFLGMEKEGDVNSIVAAGEKWTRNLQMVKSAFSYYKGIIRLISAKSVKGKTSGKGCEPIAGCNETLAPRLKMELYIAPNKKNALAVICLSLPDKETCGFEDVVNTNYHLHKSPEGQAPIIFVKTKYENGQDIYEYQEGCKTLAHVFREALPSAGYEPDNVARFHTATFVKIDASSVNVDEDKLTEDLVHLGQSKDYDYDISHEEKGNVVHLYENIWTYNSMEGFACVVKSHGDADPDFIKNSQTAFEKSYLPLFLTILMADMTYTSALRHLNEVAMNYDEQDRLREARLAVTLSVSHYDHLNRLMKSMLRSRDFEAKYQAIQSSIDSRRMKLEEDRHKIEKENQEIASQKKKEEEIVRREIEQKREASDRRINFLLGFIGVGQVVFAILQLLGANDVMGGSVADSQALNIASIVMLAVFTTLIVYLLARLFTEKKRKE